MRSNQQSLALLIAACCVVALLCVVTLEFGAKNSNGNEAEPTELEYSWRGHEYNIWHIKKKYDAGDKAWQKNTWETFNQQLAQKVSAQNKLVKKYDSFHTASYDPNVKVRTRDSFQAEAYQSLPIDADDTPVVPVMKNSGMPKF